ncbi:TPA: hypothetical protein DCX16_04590 [bacterium]|nr:hypothetical protein [bacterium]
MRRILVSILFIIFPNIALSVSKGITGATFLKIDALPRPSGLGGGFSAIADDLSSLYYNPAGLARIKLPEGVTSGGKWIGESRFGIIGYCSPVAENSGFGASIFYLKTDKMPLYKDTTSSNPEGEFDATNLCIRFGCGIEISKDNYFGIVGGWINQRIEKEKSNSFFIDIGEIYRPWFLNKAQFSVVLQNIGRKIKFINEEDKFPSTLRVGICYEIVDSANVVCDFVKPIDYSWKVQCGIEWQVNDILTLRGGYNSQVFQDLGAGVTLGLGIMLSTFQFDYAYVPYDDLGDTHRFSFKTHFGKR